MARVKELGTNGILVTGRRLNADGTPDRSPMTLRPEKAQFWNGVLWSAETVQVTPDENGAFWVGLPPGVYQAETPTWTGRIVVPVGVQSVRFEDIVQSS